MAEILILVVTDRSKKQFKFGSFDFKITLFFMCAWRSKLIYPSTNFWQGWNILGGSKWSSEDSLKPGQMVGTLFGCKTAAESSFNSRTSKTEIDHSHWIVTIDSGPWIAWRSGLIIWNPGLDVPGENRFPPSNQSHRFSRIWACDRIGRGHKDLSVPLKAIALMYDE